MKLLCLSPTVQAKICLTMITLLNDTNVANMIDALVGNSILKGKTSVTVLFSDRIDRIDAHLKSIYEKTIFGVHLVNRLDGKYDAGVFKTELEWFLVISGDVGDAWWKRAVAEVYKRGPYRPTVVLWFDKSLTMSDRYQILQVTLHEYWLHKTIIVYPSQCASVGNCVVLTTAKDTGEIDTQPSMVSLLADANNITAAFAAMKGLQQEFETNFQGRKLKATAAIKMSFVEEIDLPGNQTQLVGVDVEAFNEVCNQLNLTPTIEIVGRGSVYIDKLNATLLSLDGRKEYVALNRYFNSPLTNDYLIPVAIDSLYFVIQNRMTRNQSWKILSGFQPKVWTAVCFTFVAVAVLWRSLLPGSTLSLVQATVSTSHIKLQRTSHRLVWISWLLFVLLTVNSLNGTIVTQLTKPIYNHKINTLQDLLESDIRLFTEVRGFPNERQDPVVTALVANMADVYTEQPSPDAINRAALLTSANIRSVLRRVSKQNGHEFYVIPEVVDRTFSGYLMSPRNPAFDTFKTTVMALLESGYYEKWTREYVTNVTLNTKRYYFYLQLYNSTGGRDRMSAMSLEDLELAFHIYLTGVFLASLAFLAEMVIFKFLKRKHLKHFQTKRRSACINRSNFLKNQILQGK